MLFGPSTRVERDVRVPHIKHTVMARFSPRCCASLTVSLPTTQQNHLLHAVGSLRFREVHISFAVSGLRNKPVLRDTRLRLTALLYAARWSMLTSKRRLPEHVMTTHVYVSRLQGRDDGADRLRLRVLDPPLRQHVVYNGAAILGDVMAGFDDGWTTRAEYDADATTALRQALSGLPGS